MSAGRPSGRRSYTDVMTRSRTIRIRVFLAATLLLLAASMTTVRSETHRSTDRTADEAALRELKQVLWPRAYFTQDTRLLDRILADEFQSVDGEGNWSTKAEELDWISKNKPSHDGFEFVIRRLDIFENGTAVVAGTGIIRGRDANGPFRMEYQSSNLFIKRAGIWRAVASHVSGARRR
jgi:hypothetical protein